MNDRILAAAFAAILSSSTIASAAVIYDSGTPNRPLSITDLTFANGTFTATFDYSAFFGDAVIDPSVITGSDIATIRSALQSQLNLTGIDSRLTTAWISVSDPAPFGSAGALAGAAIFDNTTGANNWSSAAFHVTSDSATTGPIIALVTFAEATSSSVPSSPVPEPASWLLMVIGAARVGARRYWRRKEPTAT